MLLASGSLFALAGAYRVTTVPIAVVAAGLAAAVRPRVFERAHRAYDLALSVCLAVVALQLVPLPAAARAALSPSAGPIERALLLDPDAAEAISAARPLTLDPISTAWALALGVGLILTFWTARTVFETRGGVRTVARGIAWLGLALAVVTLVQRALTPEHIYGLISPTSRTTSPAPYGPFVNRNDFATWALMAVPVVLGYLFARLASRRRNTGGPIDVERALDTRAAWLILSAGLLTVALVTSLSRGGLVSFSVALVVLVGLAYGRLPRAQVRALAGALALLLVIAVLSANLPALAGRIGDTWPSGMGGRLTLWREAWPMVPDFLLTGVGAGAFERAMLVYQQSTRLIFFNHAHNEYLQMLIEGGLLLALPALVAIVAGARTIVERLRTDRSAIFWIRAGAAAAAAAVATQSVWDTGLRLPANGVLFAIVAALAVHRGEERGSGE